MPPVLIAAHYLCALVLFCGLTLLAPQVSAEPLAAVRLFHLLLSLCPGKLDFSNLVQSSSRLLQWL